MGVGNISFDPSNPATWPSYINQGSTRLEIKDTQVQLGGSQALTNSFSASSPELTILGYRELVSTTTNEEEKQRLESALFESTQYLKVRYDRAITADSIRELIARYENYRKEIKEINDTIQSGIDDYNEAVNEYNDAVNSYADGDNGYFDFADTVTDFNNYDPTTDGDIDDFRADYNDKVNDYNDKVAELNQKIAEFNQSAAEYEGIRFEIAATITNLNESAAAAGLNVPPIALPPVGQSIPPLVSNAITSPPAQPGVFNPNSPYYQQFSLAAVFPTYPQLALPIFFTGTEINEDNYNATYIDPLEQLLKTIEDVNERVNNEINFQDYFQLAFGQRNITSGFQEVTGESVLVGNSGTSGMLATANSNQKADPRLQEKPTLKDIIEVYRAANTYPSSETLAALSRFQDDAIKNLVLTNVLPGASAIAGSGLIGPDALSSPSILAGVALNALQNLQILLSSGDIFKQVVAILGANPSDDQLVELAQGITAAIKLNIAKSVILQLESAIGAAGLLSQLLANLGSLNTDSILKLTQGLISYKNAFENPFAQEALISITSQALQEQGLSAADANQIARASFNQASLDQAARASEDRAKQAFLDAVREQLAKDEALLADYEKTAQRIQTALDNSNEASLQFQEQLKADTFAFELKKELSKEISDKDDLQRIQSRLDNTNADLKTADERKSASLKVLADEGVDNAEDLVNQALSSATNPLRSFVQTEPLSQNDLAGAFSERVQSALNQPGAVAENSAAQAAKFTDLTFTAPNSISNLISQNIQEYNKQVKDDQGDKAVELFKDGVTFNWDAARLANDKYNIANFLVYSDKPAYAGIHGKVMGGGSPAGTGYVSNDKFV